MTISTSETDQRYLEIILNRIMICKDYKPAFGRKQKVTFAEFQELYGADVFYAWFGLNDPLVYAAHTAAGGITSIYRQIGLGFEELFRQILQDYVGLEPTEVTWSYVTTSSSGRQQKLSLDGCIQLSTIKDAARHNTITRWMHQAAGRLDVSPGIIRAFRGIVFEVRQGYRSKDSKRQNADIANAATAYSQGYFPVLLVLSTQIDTDIVERYERSKWLILQGHLVASPLHSTYTFLNETVGYDLAGFFRRNTSTLRTAITETLQTLLGASAAND